MVQEVIDVRPRLEGEVADKFLRIKAVKGLKHNTEVVRLLIAEYHEQMERKV